MDLINTSPLNRDGDDQVKGNWKLFDGDYWSIGEKPYHDVGLRKPNVEDLPVVQIINEDGSILTKNRLSGSKAAEFIEKNV